MGWLGLAGLPDCAHGRALFSWYVLLLMALYVPAGWVVSRLRGWPRPDRKTGCKAVLYPALCAWGWAFGGCGLLLLFSGREALFPLAFTGFALLALSFLLASPSALFMLLTLDLLSGSLRDAGVNAFFQSSAWFAAMFLAGLLPPHGEFSRQFSLAPFFPDGLEPGDYRLDMTLHPDGSEGGAEQTVSLYFHAAQP